MVVVAILPGLCSFIPDMVKGPETTFQGRAILICRILMEWAMNGIIVLFWVRGSMRIWMIATDCMPKASRICLLLASSSLVLPVFALLSAQWFSYQLLMSHWDHQTWLGLLCSIPFVAWSLLLFFLWRSRSAIFARPFQEAAPERATPDCDLQSTFSV